MSSLINAGPNVYDFGLAFNYANWTEGTNITLVNVPWNNDYRDIVKFSSRVALNTYIDGLETSGIRINNVSYVKANHPIRLDVPFNSAYRYNYLRASNPLQPLSTATPNTPVADQTRDFYYFITDVRYIAPNTTEVVVQLDVWQTFGYDINFGNSYIERGHIGIANSHAFDNYGRDYLTVPEGIDMGSEYQVIAKRNNVVMSTSLVDEAVPAILAASTVDLTADAGNAAAPILVSARGSNFTGLVSGAQYYIWEDAGKFQAFMDRYAAKPWVTQGIISITMIPDIRRYQSDFTYAPYDATYPNADMPGNPSGSVAAPTGKQNSVMHDMFTAWRDAAEVINNIPLRYRHLTKFLTSPYMMLELTTFTGAPVVIKPESWANADATVMERAALVPPNQRVSFHPFKYNAIAGSATDPKRTGTSDVGGDDNGEYLDIGVSIANFPSSALVNNNAIGYMASNFNGIAFQRHNADWSQQRALRGNEVTYDQSSGAIATSKAVNEIGVTAGQDQTQLGNVTAAQHMMIGGVSGIAGGAASGGGAGAAMGALGAMSSGANMAVQVNANNASQSIRSNAANRTNAATTGQQGMVRDTNKDLSDWAAKGDYENTVAGINAKVQDAQLIQPSVSGQIGGESMNFINNNVQLSLRFKMIDQASIRTVGEYWLRYGYAVRKFSVIPVSLQVMTKFTYWKLKETYIIGAPMPETFKQVIRGIFEKGVTVWAQPDYIGQTDIGDNAPLTGITL